MPSAVSLPSPFSLRSLAALLRGTFCGGKLRVHKCCTRETQTDTHLLREEQRIENVPSPTPSQDCQRLKPEDLSIEDAPKDILKSARSAFVGVMDDMGDHLLSTSRPPVSRLVNGSVDWQDLNSLAVVATSWRGEVLVLVLCAKEPAAAERLLKKYSRIWNASLRKWFGCEVEVIVNQGSI
jgi:hypothetical protein